LTVYEAKGLEFNDVIIYNFFDESETNSSQWRLLNDVVYKTEKRPKISQEILDMDLLDNKNFQEF
jgi:DNA helicase IV